jgi:exosome complex component RRP46
MAAIHGPLAPLNMNKEGEKAIVSVVIKSGRQDKTSALEYEWGEFLCNVLSSCMDRDRYPRSVVEVVLQIIQGDGSLLSCLLHAAVAALMDAGVELLYLPVATTCLVHDTLDPQSASSSSSSNSAIYLDPSGAEEEEGNTSILVLVNETTQPDKILGSHTIGHGLPLDKMLACVQVAAKACPAILAFWRLAVEQKVTRESQTLWSK